MVINASDVVRSGSKCRTTKLLRQLAVQVSIQYALYTYLYYRKQASLREIHSAYCSIVGRVVSLETVRKQLKLLERKGLVKLQGSKYVALMDPSDAVSLFDVKRSRAGRQGALKRVLKIKKKEELQVPGGLAYYVKQVIDKAKHLIKQGKRAAALDLIAHTLLPLRENAVLWLWHRDLFVYYEPKTCQFHAIKSVEVARLLERLSFTEGIMVLHTLGHREASDIIRRLFKIGQPWFWSRSVSYGLKLLGFLHEAQNYIIEIAYDNGVIKIVLRDPYTDVILCEYSMHWRYELPQPLSQRKRYKSVVLGVQHVKEENEQSYFSKWSR